MRKLVKDPVVRFVFIVIAWIVLGALALCIDPPSASAGGPDATPTPFPSMGSTVYTSTQSVQVNLRPDAEFFAQKDCVVYDSIVVGYQTEVLRLEAGNGITVDGWSADGVWAHVTDGTNSGWTLTLNLSDHPPLTAPVPANACSGTNACGTAAPANVTITDGGPTYTKCVAVDGLNRRTGPGTWYSVAGSAMGRGTQVSLTGNRASNGWVQAVTPGGITAWVNGSTAYLGACGSAHVPAAPAPAPASSCVESEILAFSPRLRELNGEQIFDGEDLTSGAFQGLLFDGQHVDWPGRNDDGAPGTDGELDTRIQLFGSYVAEYFYRQGTWYRINACSGTLADLAVRIGSEKAARNPWLNVTVYGPSGEVLASFPATQ